MSTSHNKVAVVSGAASGIGQALARNLAMKGADAALADVQIDAARAVAADIRATGGSASAHYLHVTDSGAVKNFVERRLKGAEHD